MKTYQIHDGDTLVVSVNSCAWEIITFAQKDFQDPQAASAEELVEVLNRSGSLAASIGEGGELVIATAAKGGHVSLEVDLAASTVAAALGLIGGPAAAQGAGPRAARHVSQEVEPFALSLGAEMVVIVDDHRRKITFDEGITAGKASAAEVAKVINAKRRKIAEVARDGRVVLTSPSLGVGSKLQVEPAAGEGKRDAATILGFIGVAAFDQPHPIEPARLSCHQRRAGLQVVNLTASPIEFHLSTGPTLLAGYSHCAVLPAEAANLQLQRLVKQGAVRLTSANDD